MVNAFAKILYIEWCSIVNPILMEKGLGDDEMKPSRYDKFFLLRNDQVIIVCAMLPEIGKYGLSACSRLRNFW